MNRVNVEALVKLGAPVEVAEARAIAALPFVARVETSSAGAEFGRVFLDAVHFTPSSYPDAVTDPVDAPTVSGTEVTRPLP